MDEELLKDEHEEREKKRKKKTALTVGLAVIIAGLLLFFDTFYHLIATGQVRRGSLIDKIGGRISKLSPEEERVLMTEVKRFFDEGKVEQAREKVLSLVQRAPSSESYLLAGMIYLRQGNIRGAYDYLRESVRLNPKNLAAQEKLGEIFILVGDYKAAKKQAVILSEQVAFKENALMLEAELALREGNQALALKKASEALKAETTEAKKQVFLASIYWRLGEKGKASEIISQLQPKDMDAEGILSLARYWAFTGDEKKAQELYAFGVDKYPSYPEILYQYGLFLFGQRKFPEAASYLERAHQAMPDTAIIAYHLGQAYIAANKLERVRSLLADLFNRDPRGILAWRLKGDYHLALGDRRGAIEAMRKVTQFMPEASFIYAMLAELYLKEGELAQAERCAHQALNMGERSLAPRLVLGELHYRRGQWGEARNFYYEVLKAQPNNLIALLMAGDCELNLRHLKEAQELYRKAELLYPQASFIQARLAKMKLALGDKIGALSAVRSYYNKNPKEPAAVIEYASILTVNGRLTEAERVLEEGMRQLPENGHIFLAAGDLQLLKGEREKAADMYRRAEAVKSNDPNLLINVAARYTAIKKLSEARRVYLMAYKKYPADVHVLNEVTWFFIDTLGKPDEATEMVELLKKKAEGANEKDTVGWYYFLKGKEKEAEYYIADARKVDPQNPVINAHYALVLDKLGRSQEAREEAKRVLDKLPSGELKGRLVNILRSPGP